MVWERLMVPQIVGFFAAFVAVAATPKHAPHDFFAASAQIVVVLILAVALQSRLLWVRSLPEIEPTPAPGHSEPVGDNRGGTFFARAVWAVLVTVPLLYAQFASLAVILKAGNRGGDPQAIMGALAWTVMSLLTTAVLTDPIRQRPSPEPANGGDDARPSSG